MRLCALDRPTLQRWNETNEIDHIFDDVFRDVRQTERTDSSALTPSSSTAEAEVNDDEDTVHDDWIALQDDDGDTYYYNRRTEETTWERPTARRGEAANQGVAAPPAHSQVTKAENEEDDTVEVMSENEFERRRPETDNLDAWEQFSDDAGDPYWHNHETGETSWYPPRGWEKLINKTTVATEDSENPSE